MTRVNAGIPVRELTRAHLLAEHREIKRVCHRLAQRLAKNKFDDIPTPFYEIKKGKIAFKELFWLDKGLYTYKRYLQIRNECERRKYNIQSYADNWKIYAKKPEYWNDFKPTAEQVAMIRDRISERLNKPKPLPV
jgi:hypothetical protein